LLVTAALVAGYAYLRRRHSQQVAAQALQAQQERAAQNVPAPKGPAKAHILVDDALLKGGQTIIGGTVKNTSNEKLSGVSVELVLRRRKDATVEQTSVPIEPADLEPNQEGRYSLKLPAQDYSAVRLVSLRSGDSNLLAYTSSPGQKRPPERIEPKVVIVPRSGSRSGEFLNSPDNPARVP
ncbi:MAG TPA: FxLYD domain-containing protein, partial [Pyrinomonadaceae bacterium]|nr:FxLYD domain-containing protein [Pyrinomonadaceae bacterium]